MSKTDFPLIPLGEPTDKDFAAQIKPLVQRAKKIAVIGHERPDGDSLGSAMGLCAILRNNGFTADVWATDQLPARYKFLKFNEYIKIANLRTKVEGDLALVVDNTGHDRIGAPIEGHFKKEQIVNIDHHISNNQFGGINWVDPKAAAASELVWRLASACEWRAPLFAFECLYTGLVTDTGMFMYSNTTPRVLRMAAEMVQAGVNTEYFWKKIYLEKSQGEMELEARARSSMELWQNGKIGVVSITQRDFAETHTGPEMATEFSGIPRMLEGVELSVFFFEIKDGTTTKISIRSSKEYDASALAGQFGGGGHRQAAGCAMMVPLEEAKARFKPAAEKLFKK